MSVRVQYQPQFAYSIHNQFGKRFVSVYLVTGLPDPEAPDAPERAKVAVDAEDGTAIPRVGTRLVPKAFDRSRVVVREEDGTPIPPPSANPAPADPADDVWVADVDAYPAPGGPGAFWVRVGHGFSRLTPRTGAN